MKADRILLVALIAASLGSRAVVAEDFHSRALLGETNSTSHLYDQMYNDVDESYDRAEEPSSSCCNTCCKRCCCCDPVWSVSAGALWLQRSRARDAVLLLDENGTFFDVSTANAADDTPLLTTRDLDFNYEAGMQLSLVRQAAGAATEVSYFGLNHWRSNASFSAGTDTFRIPFDTNFSTDFDDAHEVSVSYLSELHNVEINRRVQHNDALTLLGGFRYLYLVEDFNQTITDNSGPVTGTYDTQTDNHLLGFQLGADVHTPTQRRFRIGVGCKAGVYVNFINANTGMSAHSSLIVNPPDILLDISENEEELAFIGEIGLTGTYQIAPHLAIRGGYQVMWVDGLALAPEQINYSLTPASTTTAVNDNGGLFYDGGFIGLEWRR